MYRAQKEWEAAENALETALVLEPGSTEILLALGATQESLDKIDFELLISI